MSNTFFRFSKQSSAALEAIEAAGPGPFSASLPYDAGELTGTWRRTSRGGYRLDFDTPPTTLTTAADVGGNHIVHLADHSDDDKVFVALPGHATAREAAAAGIAAIMELLVPFDPPPLTPRPIVSGLPDLPIPVSGPLAYTDDSLSRRIARKFQGLFRYRERPKRQWFERGPDGELSPCNKLTVMAALREEIRAIADGCDDPKTRFTLGSTAKLRAVMSVFRLEIKPGAEVRLPDVDEW